MVAMTVVMFVVSKVPVWDAAIIDVTVVVEVLVIDVLVDVEFIMVGVIVIVLKFTLTVPYAADVSSDVDVDLPMDPLTDVMFGIVTASGIEVLAGMNVNVFIVVKAALELTM